MSYTIYYEIIAAFLANGERCKRRAMRPQKDLVDEIFPGKKEENILFVVSAAPLVIESSARKCEKIGLEITSSQGGGVFHLKLYGTRYQVYWHYTLLRPSLM